MTSEHAIWLDGTAARAEVVAQTGCSGIALSRLRSLCDRAPVLSNVLDIRFGIGSVAAAPMLFRGSMAGVLAVANAAQAYTPADLGVLAETGRAALADYESLLRAEALGITSARQSITDFVHELRQPLGILEACAYYLEMTVTADQIKVREQLLEMQIQLAVTSRILDEGTGSYVPASVRPSFAAPELEVGPEPEVETSRVLAHSAMSLVT